MTLTGKRISHYQILSKIGEGGMASVYLAEDLKHGRRVAIKVMSSDIGTSTRFLREIEIAARLTHPHILPLHDSGVIDDQPFYVMPYIEGESLRQRILRLKSLTIDEALRLAMQIASALGYAHKQGLVHRDIKPENVLLSNNIALVADFGIARFTNPNDGTTITIANSSVGTPAYMSPEQLRPVDAIDGRTDLYALGCVFYEMLVGSPPFTGPLHSLAYQHLSVEPRSVSENRPEVPSYVVEAIRTLLAKNPAQRFDTAAQFVSAISSPSTEAATVSFEKRVTQIPTNLPKDRTPFIGRTQELNECAQLIKQSRLLTLAGLGGCGKTRLAIKVGERLTDAFPDGVWFVDLAPLTESSRVVTAVAQVLGLREESDKDLDTVVSDNIGDKKRLLILDNCEHLLPSCANFVDRLLNSCAEVRILTTTREALNVQGERVIHLPPLGVPDAKSGLNLERVQSADAIKLFIDRAKTARPSFELTSANVGAVAEVCQRLDGIPLAIELAAARVKILSIDQILTKLDDRFRLLVGRSMLPRHQTLRAVIEWSYDQLSIEEQQLLRTLSVFAGGWTLVLASKVIGNLDEFEVMELHSQLVDKSIVVVASDQSAAQRYSFLETVRQFLFDKLIEGGEAQDVKSAHFHAMLDLAEQAYSERAINEERWTTELEVESDNIRVALEYARGVDAENYLQLVGALAWFWIVRTHLVDGREHLTAALGASDAQPSRPSRVRALWGAAHMLALQGETSEARAWIDEARTMSQELGDTSEVAMALDGIGWMHFFRCEDEAACAAFEECLRLQEANGVRHLVIRAKVGLAQVLVALGRTDEAKPMAKEIIEFAESNNDKRSEHFGWHYLADCELILGNCKESLKLYQKSLALANAIGDKVETSFEVQGVAMSLAGIGLANLGLSPTAVRPVPPFPPVSPSAEFQVALRLAGAVKAEWDRLGADIHVRFWDELLDRYLGAARRSLSREDFEREWNNGRELAFDDAVKLALEIEVG
ncbi:MAG TPA: protein kinase [Pyrinomonadaceae bacterium]|nr:protein kinase [Pyrinomonadaceae bacterium]